jgi:Tfp pilus assembly protein PilV
MAGNAAMAGVMGNVAGVMKQVNDAVSTADVAKVMQQFAQQNEMMGLREELMDDALIDAFDGEGVEEESDAIVDQVLTEVSCTLILSVYIHGFSIAQSLLLTLVCSTVLMCCYGSIIFSIVYVVVCGFSIVLSKKLV